MLGSPDPVSANSSIRLESSRLVLKSCDGLTPAIVLEYLLENSAFFEPWLPTVPPDFYTLQRQALILQDELKLLESGKQFRFYIFKTEAENKVIGDITLSGIIKGIVQSCFVGYKLAKVENNRGFMTEAVSTVIEFAFSNLGLHRVEANIIPGNIASIRVVEKLGFTLEGYSRSYLKINGKWQDHLRYALVSTASH